MLELKPLKSESEKIKMGNVTLSVPGSIPVKIMVEFYDLKNIKPKEITGKDMLDMINLVKQILYMENDHAKVDKFVDSLDTGPLTEVMVFITNFIMAGKDSKKKDSSAD